MRRTLLLIPAIALLAATATPQRTTRKGHTRIARRVADTAAPLHADADTVMVPLPGSVALSGYDKTLNASRESLFVTNNGDATLAWMSVTIDYLDHAGRQLHRRSLPVACDIPPGQTRRIDIPSWDRQGVYFYRDSEPRRRVTAAASPYTVTLSVDSVGLKKQAR